MGLSNFRRKSSRMKEVHAIFVLVWSDLKEDKRVMHVISFLIDEDTSKNLSETEHVSERITKIKVRERRKIINYFQVYAPCNDLYPLAKKDIFFKSLSDSIMRVSENEGIIIRGASVGELVTGESHGIHIWAPTATQLPSTIIMETNC